MSTAPLEDIWTMRRRQRAGLISDDYLVQQKALHVLPDGYASRGHQWADTVEWICRRFACWSVLDYGCGKGALKRDLDSRGVRFDVREYDPAISGKDAMPAFADLVVCTDVLEHIEMERLGNVLNHLQSLARKAILVSVGHGDGLIQKPAVWWDAKVDEHHLEVVDLPDMPTPSDGPLWTAVLRPNT
jgi:hypothetical protein